MLNLAFFVIEKKKLGAKVVAAMSVVMVMLVVTSVITKQKKAF